MLNDDRSELSTLLTMDFCINDSDSVVMTVYDGLNLSDAFFCKANFAWIIHMRCSLITEPLLLINALHAHWHSSLLANIVILLIIVCPSISVRIIWY